MLGEHLSFFFASATSSSPSTMTRSHFRRGGTSVASIFASMRSIREAPGFLGACPIVVAANRNDCNHLLANELVSQNW
jgi:hypothetical protein